MGFCNAFKMGARLVILEAELLQFGLEPNEAAQGLEQHGMRMGQWSSSFRAKPRRCNKLRQKTNDGSNSCSMCRRSWSITSCIPARVMSWWGPRRSRMGVPLRLLGRMLQLTSASRGWLPEFQEPPLSSRSKRLRLRWGL